MKERTYQSGMFDSATQGHSSRGALPTRRTVSRRAALGLLSAAALVACAVPGKARQKNPSLGFNLIDWECAEGEDKRWIRAIREVRSIGVRRITIIPYWFADPATGTVYQTSQYSLPCGPSEQAIAQAIAYGRKQGMRVAVKPMIEIDDDRELGDVWRGSMELREDQYSEFFATYQDYVLAMAEVAREAGANEFYIGSELASLTELETTLPYWLDLIAETRKLFPGGKRRLGYAANYDEFEQVRFWEHLDTVGIDAYFPLATKAEAFGAGNPTTTTMVGHWLNRFRELRAFAQALNRPIVFSEFGLIPYDEASTEPWNWRPDTLGYNGVKSEFDPDEQMHAMQALLIATQAEGDWLEAIEFWHWQLPESEGSLYNINKHTPIGKLIAQYAGA